MNNCPLGLKRRFIMKSYEIVRQGSRFVVKTCDGSGYVSEPFKTHAAAQGYIDQLRATPQDLLNNKQDNPKSATTDDNGYESLGSKYGFTSFEGNQYALTGVPSFAGAFGLGISADNYSATCISVDGKKFTAFFEILEKDADNVVLADWENASIIERK